MIKDSAIMGTVTTVATFLLLSHQGAVRATHLENGQEAQPPFPAGLGERLDAKTSA